ncbi:MAG: hypothetical protein ACREMW_05620, partial [Gemmatimonadales bacterium]
MSLDFLLDRFDTLPATRALAGRLPAAGESLTIGGLPGSSPAVLVAALARRLTQRVFVVFAATPADAERWLADLRTLRDGGVVLFPQRESLGAEEPHVEIAGERIETVEALLSGAARIVVTTSRGSAERTGVPAALARRRLVLAAGGAEPQASLTQVAQRLAEMGYARVPTVTEVAQFSVRGGILDVYGYGMAAPTRIEWWGDEIVSLRVFDLDTQRSGEPVPRVTVLPSRTEADAGGAAETGPVERHSLLELLPSDALVVLDQESALEHEVDRAWTDAAHHLEVARRMGDAAPAREELFVDPGRWRGLLAGFARLAPGVAGLDGRFPLAPPESIDRDLKRLRQVVASAPAT